MDKNMIKIDDLVRHRLAGAEEQERTGAWLNMRDLLDEKMPARKPLAAFPWKRLMTAVTGVALLASLSVGGYRMYSTRMQQAEHSNTAKTMLQQNDVATNPSIASASIAPKDNALTKEPHTETAENKTAANTNISHQTIANTTTASSHKKIANNISKTTTSINALNNETETSTSKTMEHKANDLPTTTQNGREEESNNSKSHSPLYATNSTTNATKRNKANSLRKTTEQPNRSNSTTPHQKDYHNNQEVFAASASATKGSLPLTKNNAITTKQLIKRDTFNSITLLQRVELNPLTRKAKFVTDTVAVGKMAFEKVQTLPVKEEAPIAIVNTKRIAPSSNIAPAAALANANTSAAIAENSLLVPLSSMKVKTHRTQAWNARSFNDVVRDMQYNLSLVRFYPGIIFGINNNMFGTNTINGLHIGLTGLFTFGEHWNMMAELKYMHRINQGSNLQDNYTKITDSAINSNGQRTYLQSNVEHFFKFSTMQSLEMPIAVRYALNRVNLFAGVNMAYNFAINAEEVDRTYDSTIVVAGTPGLALRKGADVHINDFGPRFSIGYLFGVGYQLSPSVQLDFRAAQNLWDNARGNGAVLVSKQLYRMPSLQLSLSYRFNQRARIPKAR